MRGIGFLCTTRAKMRTSLGRPQRAWERLGTGSAGAAARPASPAVEALPLAAAVASLGSPVGVGVSGEGTRNCWLQRSRARCGGAGGVCTLAEVRLAGTHRLEMMWTQGQCGAAVTGVE